MPTLLSEDALHQAIAPEFPGRSAATRVTIRDAELAFILHNLATLVGNGLSLPRALAALAQERSLSKAAGMLSSLEGALQSGQSLSGAMKGHPQLFSELLIHQIWMAERSGTVAESLRRIASQLEQKSRIRRQVLARLAYPIVLAVAGTLAVVFMLTFVIPVFEKIYADAHVPLPLLTTAMMKAGQLAVAYGWIPLAAVGVLLLVWKQARHSTSVVAQFDRRLLALPFLGDWIRNIALLQFIEVFGNLLESGFRVVDALAGSAGSITNRAVRDCVWRLHEAVNRGERFGREIGAMSDVFPPVISQLIAVGEQTGSLGKVTTEIRGHLQREIERQTGVLVGVLEPVCTIVLAGMIGTILLAVYLPMFDMIGAVGKN